MTVEPSQLIPYEARAFLDDKLVAVSSAALQIELPDGTPALCFPQADLREKLPEQLELFVAAPSGYVALSPKHARVRQVIVDGAPGPDQTLKRFPVWGDAAHLIDMLNVRPAEDGGFVSVTRDNSANRHRGVVEGSQMLAQSIVAAGRRAPGRRVIKASMLFMRAANTHEPLRVQLEELSGGRNFTCFAAHVRQAGKLCASGVLMLDATAPDVMRHSAAAPDTKGPYESTPFDMSVTGRDIRFVDNAYTGDPDAPVGPPLIDAWLRYRDVPADPYLHAGLLAQFTGHVSIAAAMRAHAGIGQAQAHRSLSTAINAISISFHADVRADEWMLYRHCSTFAGDGMTHSECRVHNQAGALLASFSVEAMVRRMATDRPADARTAL